MGMFMSDEEWNEKNGKFGVIVYMVHITDLLDITVQSNFSQSPLVLR